MSKSITIDIAISSEEYLKLYQGVAKDVFTVSRDGRRIRFPAQVLRPFVTREGIRGSFRIHFDQNNKFKAIDRL